MEDWNISSRNHLVYFKASQKFSGGERCGDYIFGWTSVVAPSVEWEIWGFHTPQVVQDVCSINSIIIRKASKSDGLKKTTRWTLTSPALSEDDKELGKLRFILCPWEPLCYVVIIIFFIINGQWSTIMISHQSSSSSVIVTVIVIIIIIIIIVKSKLYTQSTVQYHTTPSLLDSYQFLVSLPKCKQKCASLHGFHHNLFRGRWHNCSNHHATIVQSHQAKWNIQIRTS